MCGVQPSPCHHQRSWNQVITGILGSIVKLCPSSLAANHLLLVRHYILRVLCRERIAGYFEGVGVLRLLLLYWMQSTSCERRRCLQQKIISLQKGWIEISVGRRSLLKINETFSIFHFNRFYPFKKGKSLWIILIRYEWEEACRRSITLKNNIIKAK